MLDFGGFPLQCQFAKKPAPPTTKADGYTVEIQGAEVDVRLDESNEANLYDALEVRYPDRPDRLVLEVVAHEGDNVVR